MKEVQKVEVKRRPGTNTLVPTANGYKPSAAYSAYTSRANHESELLEQLRKAGIL